MSRLADLAIDPGTGQVSGSKIWKHVWNVAALWAFVFLVLGGKIVDAWSVAVFMAISGGSEVASKLVSMRYGAAQAAPQEAKP